MSLRTMGSLVHGHPTDGKAMNYLVIGADRHTGADVRLCVEAPTSTEAERVACARGILVASTTADLGIPDPSCTVPGGSVRRSSRKPVIISSLIIMTALAGIIWFNRMDANRRKHEISIMLMDSNIDGRAAGLQAVVKSEAQYGTIDATQAETALAEWESADRVWRSIRSRKSYEDQVLMTEERNAREASLEQDKSPAPARLRVYASLIREMAMRWRE